MDWAEVGLRKAAQSAGEVWASSSPSGKALIALVLLVVAAVLAYAAYTLLFGGRS